MTASDLPKKRRHVSVFDKVMAEIRPSPQNEKLYRPISPNDPDIIELAESIEQLNLDDTHIHIAGLVHLKGLTNLSELRLCCPAIKDLGAGVVGELKGLDRLALSGTGLTDRGLEGLKELTGLQQLDLTNTKVTAEGVAALQKALPRCRIAADVPPGK